MGSGAAIRIVALAAFTVASISALQHTRVVIIHTTAPVHWVVVLFIVPIANGIGSVLVIRRYPYLSSLLSSAIATVVLFFLYTNFFWRQPPTTLQAAAFFANLALFSGLGVSLARGVLAGSRRRAQVSMKRGFILAYHTLAIIAAVVTLVGFIRGQ